jgi:hypothetical protein
VAEQGYLAPLDHGAGSSRRSLYALALMFPPKLTHTFTGLTFRLTLTSARRSAVLARSAVSASCVVGGNRDISQLRIKN